MLQHYAELQRTQTLLYDVRAQKDRLQYEIDNIHHQHGTYRIICHLRNEIQRLTISKLILIQTTALEMDRLRKIIHSLSRGEKMHHSLHHNIATDPNESSRVHQLNDLLPPPTPSSPPPNFSWKDTFNIDLNEEDIDLSTHENHAHHDLRSSDRVDERSYSHQAVDRDHSNNNNNDKRLDEEDDIKIPEMNLDSEDGAMKPISLINHQSSSDPDDDEDDSQNDNESNDDNDYVIERVASPEAGGHNDGYPPEDSEFDLDENMDNQQIAVAERKSLFSPEINHHDIAQSDDLTDHTGDGDGDGDGDAHHIHDDYCNHENFNVPPHDASPQLQFAGDGDDLNQIHGVATDAPILPPSSTDADGDIYGEEDHKLVISIHNAKSNEHDVDDEKLQAEADDNKKNNVLLQNEEIEDMELISEMGDDDRNPSPKPTPNIEDGGFNGGPSPSPIAMAAANDHKPYITEIEEDEKQKLIVPQISAQQQSISNQNEFDIPTPDQIHEIQPSPDLRALDADNIPSDDGQESAAEDEYEEERDDEFEFSQSRSLMVSTPTSRVKKSHVYDVSTELFGNPKEAEKFADISMREEDNGQSDENKPRRPAAPMLRPTMRARSKSLSERNVPLLNGLRLGEMDVHIGICDMTDLVDLLPMICRAMVLLPYGLKEFRNKLFFSLQSRMCKSYELAQHFTFFLNSYRNCFAVSRLFRDHICMESIVEIQRLSTLLQQPLNNQTYAKNDAELSRMYEQAADNPGPAEIGLPADDEEEKMPAASPGLTQQEVSFMNLIASPRIQENARENVIEYTGSNVVEFFRLPLCCPELGQSFVATHCTEFVCPVTSQSHVYRLEIHKIFQSNAKPVLVDCFQRDKYMPISSFILKYGDDLRRDAAVLMMFKFMNSLWSDNACQYRSRPITAQTYKCYPLGPDYGIIEVIPNCLTLKDITDKYVVNSRKNSNKLSEEVLNNIVATSAGSFMAAYIMGIRDRHYDNILVNTFDGTIFHIDFGYMLGEKVSGIDTAKFAITGDLCKLMDTKWNEFVEISVQSWVILRENQQELLEFAKLAFSFLYPQETVQEFLKERLLLHLSMEDAKSKIKKRILQSPKKIKTKMKNWVHAIAKTGASPVSSSSSKRESKNIFSSFLPRRSSKSSSFE